MKRIFFGFNASMVATLLLLTINSCKQEKSENKAEDRPNILWIVSEDNSPYLGCYGDANATTPNLDKLASEGILYTNAFANAPVCAAARSTIISGMYPTTMGTQNMRSKYNIPEFIKFFPEYLKKEGYYTTNNSKTDYNTSIPKGVWDESSTKAHYKNRKEEQPFFAIFNIGVSHESSLHKTKHDSLLRHDPAKVKLPPYHPDTPEIRHDWAQFYDKIEDMDSQVADVLKELDDAGLAENTIVAYYSDHGGILARSKRFVYETGTHVPMIWRFPEKYKHLAPAKPNTQLDRLVSFVDLAPSILSLTDVKVPDYMQGQAFLGNQQAKPREYVHLFSDRMDERFDKVRAVRNKQYRYIKNYMPHRMYGDFLEYQWRAPSSKSWEEVYKLGKCNETQSIFWNKKPTEELYDTTKDPWEVNNLVNNPEYKDVLDKMREETNDWMYSIKDSGFIPEGQLWSINDHQLIYDYVHSDAYDYKKIKQAADVAALQDKNKLKELISFTHDENPVIRYWGTLGCLILGKDAVTGKKDLMKLLKDTSPDVRITAAEALYGLGESSSVLPVLIEALQSKNKRVSLHVMNSLRTMDPDIIKASIPTIKEVIKNMETKTNLSKAGRYLIKMQH
ncbi:sulfatase-like hydrolase/transferase [Flavivirga spongiicola]|uniref:Sulfatase-like hydrolase/transferase n=1 Tax=Flavivirga spongiicola TaxID=421621 RepID=A0ABU7XXL3_9FLAO|nr:sulfatase-like hydrolase/transferase [Flavivirga sp. MEBiC05379]MDO5980278.1 sulfatase-like hydrolase/transferase [Flavivirga sp. MEBiC05379]